MPNPKGSYAETSSRIDNIKRESKTSNTIGIATFVGLRLLDPVWQYGLLAKGYGAVIIQKLGGSVIPGNSSALASGTILDSLIGLSPYRQILLAMASASMLKQNYTLLAITTEETTVPFAFMIGGYNALFNTLNDLLFLCAQTSPSNGEDLFQAPLVVGASMFVLGMGMEVIGEAQRTVWKKKAENKGKVYTKGLFGLSRHINFFGYLMWRSGFALAGGGWLWGAATAAFFWKDFAGRAIPALQHYLEERYGEAYQAYERSVPYVMIPGVY